MLKFLSRRLLTTAVTLLAATAVVFALSRMGGDPRVVLFGDAGGSISMEEYEAFGKRLGLDKPVIVQYFVYIGQVARGDFGDSILQRKPVWDIVMKRVPNSLKLALGGFLFSILFGVPLGVLAAVRRGSGWDYLARGLAIFGQSMPAFWVGLMLMFVFAVTLGWLPSSRQTGLSSFILPSVTLGLFATSGQLRILRSALLEVLDSEYVRLARAKGVPSWLVIWKHALRNALIAPLTFAGLTLAGMITGSIVIETVFAWPGLGLLAVQAVNNSDFPIIQGVILTVTLGYVLANLVVDVLYVIVDPRIRV